jgi:co-chaperonin GroES (HSP10)
MRAAGDAADNRIPHKAVFDYGSIEDAFPMADPGLEPFGSEVLVQLRTPPTKSKGGIILTEESRETDQWNTQVAKVIALGPVAFCNRETLQRWPEGAWTKPGEYVRVPKYGGDRWWVDSEGADKKSLFVVFNDLDLVGRVPEDKVLRMVAYIL